MPIFFKNKLVFIHVPKTGGSSIEETLKDNGDTPFFKSEKFFINGHSPQHSSYKELINWALIPNDFTVFSVIRHPYERFVSEYNYRQSFQKESLKSFSEKFLKTDTNLWDWDNHDKSCFYFLESCENIKILRFENFKKEFKDLTGLEIKKHEMKKEKILKLEDLTQEIKNDIYNKWKDDFEQFKFKK